MTSKLRLLKTHFYLIIFVLANFIVSLFLDFSIHAYLIFALKVIIYLTGLTLFFITIRPFKMVSIYFSLYLLSPILIFFSWIADGIFGAIIGSIFLALFYPPDTKLKDNDYVIYEKFQGFLGSCCTYDISQNMFLFLQKNFGEIRITEEHSFKDSRFEVFDKTGYLKLNMLVYSGLDNPVRSVDTTLVIDLK